MNSQSPYWGERKVGFFAHAISKIAGKKPSYGGWLR